MKSQLQIFVSLLLLTLMLFKVSSFHVYSHQDESSDEIENCLTCELAIENQSSEFVFSSSQLIKNIQPLPITDNKIVGYSFAVSSTFLRFNYFGRPPPNMG